MKFPTEDGIEILVAGDTHIGSPYVMASYFIAIKKWLDEQPNRYIIHTGDLYEAATLGSKGDPYHCLPLDQAEGEAVGWLKSLGDRLICMVDGNHDQRYARLIGKDVVADAMCKANLEAVYDGDQAFLVLKVGHYSHLSKQKRIQPISYNLYVTHGVGGGRTEGARANNLMRLREIVEADVYIQGHQHVPRTTPNSIYEFSQNAIVEKQQYFIVGASALDRKGYAVEKAYAPTSHQMPILRLGGRSKTLSASTEPLMY